MKMDTQKSQKSIFSFKLLNFLEAAQVAFVPPWEGGGGCSIKLSTNGEMTFH